MATTFRARTLDLGLPEEARDGYGTELVGAPGRAGFFYSYIEPPAALRLVHFDLATGRSRTLKGLSGELRRSVFSPKHDRLHALTSHGLHEVSLEPFTITRTLKAGLPKWLAALASSADMRFLAVRRRGEDPSQIVDTRDYRVTTVTRLGGIDAIVGGGAQRMAYSFFQGVGRTLDASGQLTGKTRAIPRLESPIVTDEAIFALAETAHPEPYEGPPSAVVGTGFVVRLDPRTLAVQGARRAAAVHMLLGCDAKGRLVGLTNTSVVLIDPASLRIVAEQKVGKTISEPLVSVTLAGPCTLVAQTQRRFSRDVLVVEWDADAKRPVVATTPLPRKPPGKVEAQGARTVHLRQTFRDVRVDKEALTLSAVDLRGCTLDGLFIDGRQKPVVIRGATAEKCVLRRVWLLGAVLDECVLSSPKCSNQPKLTGCLFRHVTLRGPVGWMRIDAWNGDLLDAKARAKAKAAAAEFYRDVDWALDIREARTGELTIEDVPLALIRRDPERQLLLRAEGAAHPIWKTAAAQPWSFEARTLLKERREGALLMLPETSSKYYPKYEALAKELRRLRLVDDVTGVS